MLALTSKFPYSEVQGRCIPEVQYNFFLLLLFFKTSQQAPRKVTMVSLALLTQPASIKNDAQGDWS